MSKVAVVILNWNGKKYLQQFLPSVVQYSENESVDVFVADNGSTDDSILFVEKEYKQIKIITLDKNYGFAEGYNRALNQIDAEYFVLLNSDVEVTENWIFPIINLMEKDKTVAAAMPKMKSFAQREYFEYAGAGGGFIDKFGYPFCRGRILNVIEKDNGQYNDNREIFWATGACMFVRADLYKQFGGLDDYFFAHMEEIDLCWRMKNAGFKIMYVAEVEVFHVGGGTLPNNNPKKIYLNYRNNLFLLYKNLPENKILSSLIFRMILDGFSALVYLLSFRFSFFKAVIQAHFAFYQKLPDYRKQRKQFKQLIVKEKHGEMLQKSIVFSFFIFKKKSFNLLFE